MHTICVSVSNGNVPHFPLVKCLLSFLISAEEKPYAKELVERTLEINNEEKEKMCMSQPNHPNKLTLEFPKSLDKSPQMFSWTPNAMLHI